MTYKNDKTCTFCLKSDSILSFETCCTGCSKLRDHRECEIKAVGLIIDVLFTLQGKARYKTADEIVSEIQADLRFFEDVLNAAKTGVACCLHTVDKANKETDDQ